MSHMVYDLDFRTAFNRLETHIEERYGLPVVITDVIDPNTGDFDGLSISLDWDQDLELAVFVLAHLFGHTVQWATDPEARDLGLRYGVERPPPELLPAIRDYEMEAARYASQLFREAGLEGFDGWLADWTAADWGYLELWYRTGERGDARQFLHPGANPPLEPLTTPPFRPERWVSRWAF